MESDKLLKINGYELNLEKLRSKKLHRVSFDSRSQAKRFMSAIRKVGYDISEDGAKKVRHGIHLLIFGGNCMSTTVDTDLEPCSAYLSRPVKEAKGFGGLPSTRHCTHYITKPLTENPDLSLRYYIQFSDRTEYEGKWFIKEGSTKRYLEIPEAFAKKVNEEMTTEQFKRVIGFRTKGSFRRITVDAKGEAIIADKKGGR